MVQQPGENAHHHDNRQGLQSQYKAFAGIGNGKRCRAASQITEQEFHAGAGCGLQCNDSACEQIKDKAELRDKYEQACDDELQCNSTGGKFHCMAHGKGIAPFRQQPGNQRNHNEPAQALQH